MGDIRVIHRFELKKLNILVVSVESRASLDKAESWPGDALLSPNYASLPSLLIYQDQEKGKRIDPSAVVRVELYGPNEWMGPCEEAARNRELVNGFEMNVERRGDGSAFAAEARDKGGDWNALLTALLEFSLLEGRPVRSFQTTFLFPFTLRRGERSKSVECKMEDRHIRPMRVEDGDVETVLYFLPHIRDILFGQSGGSGGYFHKPIEKVQRWELDGDIGKFKLQIQREAGDIDLDLFDARLFLFPNNHVYFLTFSVTLQNRGDIEWDAIEKPLALID